MKGTVTENKTVGVDLVAHEFWQRRATCVSKTATYHVKTDDGNALVFVP